MSSPRPRMFSGSHEPEGEADQRRLRTQRDVALLPREADADHLLALVLPARDVSDVAHGGGVRTRCRTGERKARNLQAFGEAWQVMFLLFGRAVFLDQLARAQRVRHHDDGAHVRRSGGDPSQDQRLRLSRKAKTAMLFRDEHAEKAVLLGKIPDFLRDVLVAVPDRPVVGEAAEFVGWPVEERLLFLGQGDGRHGAQLVPVGLAGEQLGVEADGASIERLLLGSRYPGEYALDLSVERLDQDCPPHRRYAEGCKYGDQYPSNDAKKARL